MRMKSIEKASFYKDHLDSEYHLDLQWHLSQQPHRYKLYYISSKDKDLWQPGWISHDISENVSMDGLPLRLSTSLRECSTTSKLSMSGTVYKAHECKGNRITWIQCKILKIFPYNSITDLHVNKQAVSISDVSQQYNSCIRHCKLHKGNGKENACTFK